MELMLFIGNDCIDSISIKQEFLTIPGYVGHIVKALRRKNEKILCETTGEPEFLLYGYSVQRPKQVVRMKKCYLEEANPDRFMKAG